MSHLAPPYQILWMSNFRQIFWETGPFLVPFCHGKSQFFMAYHTQSMQSVQVKSFSFGRIFY